MKKFIKFTLPAIIFFVAGCKKETANNVTQSISTLDNQATNGSCFKSWQAVYANGIKPNDTIHQIHFIKNGVAQCPPRSTSVWKDYFTNIFYPIPACHYLNGNNIIFEACLKNPPNQAGSVYGYDVVLEIRGSKNSCIIYFVGAKAGQRYNYISVGNFRLSNRPALVHLFADFDTVAVHLKEAKLEIYLNNVLIKEVNYDPVNDLGEIKSIACGFKGTGSIDRVKLYERKTGALLMQEDFNVAGETTAIWFD